MIHHVIAEDEWGAARRAGRIEPGPGLAFIHCCAPEQLDAIVAAFYADVVDLFVLDLDASVLPVRWEPPDHPGGRPADANEGLFPHVYGAIDVATAVRAAYRYVMSPSGSDRSGNRRNEPSG